MDLDLIGVTTSSISPFSQCGPDRDSRRDVFFNRLANRRFPAGAFIRPEEELDYLQERMFFTTFLAMCRCWQTRSLRLSWFLKRLRAARWWPARTNENNWLTDLSIMYTD
jgi:hypothetical protein